MNVGVLSGLHLDANQNPACEGSFVVQVVMASSC